MLWLVDAFFALHRRRKYSEVGPEAVSFSDMADYSNYVLYLPEKLRPLFFRTIADVDDSIREYLFEKSRAKMDEIKNSHSLKNKKRPGKLKA